MAKKRLNKKVALIGSAVFVFLVLVMIAVILYLSRDAEKFINDGDAALRSAREATNDEIKKEEYSRAQHSYHKARNLAKTDSLRVEVLFKLVDLYIETGEWRNVIGCWNRIVAIDPENIKAQYGRLKYYYILAGSGVVGFWQEVESQVSELLEVVEDKDMLSENLDQWKTSGIPDGPHEGRKVAEEIGPYLYLLRGRAIFEKVRRGMVTDPDELLARAIEDLEKVIELRADCVDAYWYLARVIANKGELFASRGNVEDKDKALEQVKQLLERSVEVADNDVQAHIILLDMKPEFAQMNSREQLLTLEPEYLALVERFNSSPQAHSTFAEYYTRLGYKYFDKAIGEVEKAIELDKENVAYAVMAASLYYRRSSIYGRETDFYKALETAKNALTLPNAQDSEGPRQWINKNNRAWLCDFLANCYIERVLEFREQATDSEVQDWIENAEKMVYEIEQIFGSGEEPRVIKWRGMLDLAKGNRKSAIRKLYATYEQLEASGQRDAQLSYTLAKLFEGSTELGAANDFYASALSIFNRSVPGKIDESKPEVLLDYVDILLKLRAYSAALNIIDFFENEYWSNERSRTLRVRILISTRQFDEVEKELADANPNDPNVLKLKVALMGAKVDQVRRAVIQRQVKERSKVLAESLETAEKGALLSQIVSKDISEPDSQEITTQESTQMMTAELNEHTDTLSKLVEQLLLIEPNSVEDIFVTSVCSNYVAQGKEDKAEAMVNKYLQYFPDNKTILFYKQLLAEPKPADISQEKRKQLEKNILLNITDPVARALSLGEFYRKNNEPNKVVEQYLRVLETADGNTPISEDHLESLRVAAGRLADMGLRTNNLELVERIVNMSRDVDLDSCEGKVFTAIAAMIREDYKSALADLNEALKQRPVYSYGYMVRSTVNSVLGNEHMAIEDIQKAVALNPLDGGIAKGLTFALYRRNQKLGDNISSKQLIEARSALDRAMSLNPKDMQLLSFYAEYISSTEPLRALAIRQQLQKNLPTMENALLLGRLAMRMAMEETNKGRKEVLFTIARSSFEEAQSFDPQNHAVLENFAEYYRITDQREKAEQLLTQSKDQQLLWRYYFRAGRFEDAEQILEHIYTQQETSNAVAGVREPKVEDIEVIKGLLLVVEKIADQNSAKRYTEELLSLEDNIENHLYQIQTFLKVGLIKEAGLKSQSFNEKYPDEPRGLQLNAWLAMRQGKLNRALELINQSLEVNQDNPVGWRLRGQINFFMANYDQAILDLKKSKSLSDNPITRITLAKAYLRSGREEDAITELENTIDDPHTPVEGGFLLEQIYLKLNRLPELKKFYEKVLKLYPKNLLWYDQAAKFSLIVKNYEQAEQLYKYAFEKSDYKNRDLLDGYLRALLLGGKLDDVFEEGRKHIESGLAPVAYSRMAQARLKLDDRTGAMEYYQKAIDKAGTNEDAIGWVLDKIYVHAGPEMVRQICEEKLQTDTDSFAANFVMFGLNKMEGQYNKALNYIDKCIEKVSPGSQHERNFRAQRVEVLLLAYVKTSDNDYIKSAIKEYESLLAKMPDNTGVLNNLAFMFAELKIRLDEAIEYAKRALDAKPNDPGYLDTYSYVLYRNAEDLEAKGEDAQAKESYLKADEYLQSALQQYEQTQTAVPADVYKHLGMIKEKLGEKAPAIDAYQQALEVGANTLPQVTKKQIEASIERLL